MTMIFCYLFHHILHDITDKLLTYKTLFIVLKNVLIDQNCKDLAQEEFKELLLEYDSKFIVGKDINQTSFDENCASFCVDRNCDFLTNDRTAFQHFFKVKSIKSIQIARFRYEDKAERWTYRVRIENEQKEDLSKGVKL